MRARTKSGLLLVCVAWAVMALAAEYEPVKSRLVPVQVSSHAYYVQGRPGVASAENEGFNNRTRFSPAILHEGKLASARS